MPHYKYVILTTVLVCILCCEQATNAESPTNSIAFASFAPLNTDLMVADADGSNPIPLLPHSSLDYNASYSQDGKWITFTSERNGSADVYRVHPDGGSLEQLTDHKSFDDQAALSPDGTLLAFVSSRFGTTQIATINVAPGERQLATNGEGEKLSPRWLNNDRIAFGFGHFFPAGSGAAKSATATIAVINTDGSGLRQLTNTQENAGFPSWSPDEKHIVYRRFGGNKNVLMVLEVETGRTRALTIDLENLGSPKWSPRGKLIVFSGRRLVTEDYDVYTIKRKRFSQNWRLGKSSRILRSINPTVVEWPARVTFSVTLSWSSSRRLICCSSDLRSFSIRSMFPVNVCRISARTAFRSANERSAG